MLSIQWRQEITLWIILCDAIESSSLSTKTLLLMYYVFQKTVSQKASFPKFISPMNLIMRIVIFQFHIQGITEPFTKTHFVFFGNSYRKIYFKAIFTVSRRNSTSGDAANYLEGQSTFCFEKCWLQVSCFRFQITCRIWLPKKSVLT